MMIYIYVYVYTYGHEKVSKKSTIINFCTQALGICTCCLAGIRWRLMVQRCTLQLALRVVVLLQAIQVLLQVMQGRIITLSFLNLSLRHFGSSNQFIHRSYSEGKIFKLPSNVHPMFIWIPFRIAEYVAFQALTPTLTQSTCDAAAALQKCEQVEQWKFMEIYRLHVSCQDFVPGKCGKWMEIIVCYSCFLFHT